MDLLNILVLGTMGILAGMVNAAVGSGSLLTLPVLLALGLPPGEAVRTNTIGMSFATVGSVLGFRSEIAAERGHLRPLSIATILGATTGSILLLLSPSSALDVVVPILIVVALILVAAQPRIARWVNSREASTAPVLGPVGKAYRRPSLLAPMALASVYGGYFTAAQGILYMAIMGAATGRDPKAVNPVKNLLSLYVNVTAALVYLAAHARWGASIMWPGVVVLAVSGIVGGYVGSHVAKRLPSVALRAVIVVVALVALVRQFWG